MRGFRPQPGRVGVTRRGVVASGPLPERAESELDAVLESVDNAVLLLDAEGRLRRANPRFGQWMEIEPAEWNRLDDFTALARRMASLFRAPEEFQARWRSIQQGEEAVWDELEQVKPERRVLERLSRPLFDAAGKRNGRLEVYRDITGERLIQSQLLQTEKMAALGQLVAGIAHELNNPLTSIMGYAQLSLARERSPHETSHAGKIFEEAQRAHRIVKNLLLFARETKPERAPVQLNEIVERTLALRGYELKVKNIVVQADLESSLPRVSGDAHQLQQLVLNLLVNAEQAVESAAASRSVEEAGTAARSRAALISIRTWHRRKTSGADGRVILEVCDNGPGISPEVAARVFDPFFTTKPIGVGTGLGLSIVYGIVRGHQGEITVTSGATGPGGWRTVFSVELPALSGSAGARPSLAPIEIARMIPLEPSVTISANSREPRRVLVVEDEPTVARLVADVLRPDGMEVETAMGGQAGLDRVLDARAPEFDLIICDLKMPGIDGPALYRELTRRNHPAKDRILFITGDTLSRRTLEFLQKLQARFLAKPFLADELRLAVQHCLDARSLAESKH